MSKLKYFLIILIMFLIAIIPVIKHKETKSQVVFWTVQLSPFADYINEVIEEFETAHPDIKIKWVDVPYSEAEKRVLASLLSNSMPDLINITSDFNMTLAVKGALAPFDDGLWAYNDALLNTLTYDKKVWGIPFYATSAITVYNKELLNDFGITTSAQTYDELFSQMEKAQILKNKYLFMPTLTENDTVYKIMNKYDLSSPETLESKDSERFFTELKKLYTEEKIPKEAITQTHREVLEKYSSGQIGYLQAGANFLNIIKENSPDVYQKTDVKEQFRGNKKGFDFSLMTLAVPQRAHNKKKAFLFAKYLTNARNQLEFAKLTGILPCNKETLKNEYFSSYDSKDIQSKARYTAAKQLLTPITYPKRGRNQKEIISLINSMTEKILIEHSDIKNQLAQTRAKWLEYTDE